MARRGESVGTHAAVVLVLVVRLTKAGQTHHVLPRGNIFIVNNFASAHASNHRAVDNYGTHEVAHVRRLASSALNVHARLTQILKYGLRSLNKCFDHLTGN